MSEHANEPAGHSHSHGHGSMRLRPGTTIAGKVLAIGIGLCVVGTLVAGVLLRPAGHVDKAPGVIPGTVFVNGTVITIESADCPQGYDATTVCSTAAVRITSGPTEGGIAHLQVTKGIPGAVVLQSGDHIRMSYFAKGPRGYRYTFDDFQRHSPMLLLVVVFAASVILLSRMQGVRALLGMAISLAVIVAFLLPALLRGGPPLPLALVTAITVAFAALYLAHGVHVGTHVAFAGSVLALLLTTILGAAFIAACHFTGYSDEYAATLTVANAKLDIRGLILAGLVIGALGVLDDITVTQVSAVAELQATDPSLSAYQLYRSGLRIGRDHVASTVNTLVLAYAGASLPLLLLFSQGGRSIGGVITSELVAVELVRALVGSIGLVAAVPITNGLAAWVVHRPPPDRVEANPDSDSPDPGAEVDPWRSLSPVATDF